MDSVTGNSCKYSTARLQLHSPRLKSLMTFYADRIIVHKASKTKYTYKKV